LRGLRCAVARFGPRRIDTHGAFAAQEVLRHNIVGHQHSLGENELPDAGAAANADHKEVNAVGAIERRDRAAVGCSPPPPADYRHAREALFRAQLPDLKAAARYLRSTRRWIISPANFRDGLNFWG